MAPNIFDTHSATDVLEKEEVKISHDGDHDRFQHYFKKDAISNNLLTGAPMRALCGKVVKSQVDPKGRTICQTCQDILDEVFPES